MGVLIDGKWTDGELPQETGETGQFKRVDSVFRDRITADGSSGFKAEPGRYHLYVAHGCPWAHRTLIYRALKKLDGLISVAYSIPGLKTNGWTFEQRSALPGLHPRHGQRLPLSARGLYREQPELHRQGHGADAVGQEDQAHRQQRVRPRSSGCSTPSSTPSPATAPTTIRRRCAPRSTPSTSASTTTSTTAFTAAASPSRRRPTRKPMTGCSRRSTGWRSGCRKQRYLVGNQITEADWRLFPTLVRFDVAYFSMFKCNRQRIADYPEPVELHARALSGAGRRRHGDAALLRHQLLLDPQGEPDRDHPEGNAGRSRPAARSRAARGVSLEERMLELYHNINSVCAQKVRIALKEKGQDAKEHLLTLRAIRTIRPT